jgi:hypothetical protein
VCGDDLERILGGRRIAFLVKDCISRQGSADWWVVVDDRSHQVHAPVRRIGSSRNGGRRNRLRQRQPWQREHRHTDPQRIEAMP